MTDDLTQILRGIDAGDPDAARSLLPLVYDELRRLAAARLAQERRGATLQGTELVHEAYLRLLGPEAGAANAWSGRGHFFAAAAEAMRRILIDRARARGTAKRGGSWRRADFAPAELPLDEIPAELLDLDEALRRFEAVEPEKARLVALRFFAGLTLEQAAAALGISTATATRHWSYARAWLYRELERIPGEPPNR